MNIKARIFGAFAAASVLCTALPSGLCLTADAEPLPPESIPISFFSAYEFEEQYGAFRIADGMIITVRYASSEDTLMRAEYFTSDGSAPDVVTVYETVCRFVMPEEPKQEDYADYKEYAQARDAFYEEYGSYADLIRFPGEVNQEMRYYVGAFIPQPNTKISFRFVPQNESAVSGSLRSYTFVTDAEGNITETDLFGWLPDCPEEYARFTAENPAITTRDGLVIHTGEVNHSTGAEMTVEQQGSAVLEKILEYSCSRRELIPLVGSGTNLVQVYSIGSPGTVKLSVSTGIPWYPESIETETQCFDAAEDGTVTPITEEEFEARMDSNPGDCNRDGRRDISDLVTLVQFLLKGTAPASAPNADLNGDGRINAVDLTLLKRVLMTPVPPRDGGNN